jgi:MFS transporter, DHA1 family, multidrug resistance protein
MRTAPEPAPAIDWRANLSLLWLALFTSGMSFTFVAPFLPLFINRDLHVHDLGQVAIWSGVAWTAAALASAVSNPLWGLVADRFGRKRLLIRAMVGAALASGAVGLVQGVGQLIVLRALLGAAAGVNPATAALAADQAPRDRLSWSLGTLAAARSIGQAAGPVLSGLLASFLSLRLVFAIGAGALALAAIPIAAWLTEAPVPAVRGPRTPTWTVIRASGAGTATVILALLAVQALLNFAYAATQQLVALRILVLDPAHAAAATGVAFAAMAVATAAGAFGYSSGLRWTGFKGMLVATSLGTAGAIGLLALASEVAVLVVAGVLVGLLFGAAIPTLASMLGLESPTSVKATVFGFNSSALSLGLAGGPLAAGWTAATVGLTPALTLGAVAAILAAAVAWLWTRNPADLAT